MMGGGPIIAQASASFHPKGHPITPEMRESIAARVINAQGCRRFLSIHKPQYRYHVIPRARNRDIIELGYYWVMDKQSTWHKYFMDMAMLAANKSGDDSLGVGCVIVGPNNEVRSTGYNGLPRGLEYTPERRERPAKYAWTEHAERNAIYNAARVGVPLEGCRAYIVCTDLKRGGRTPCVDCTRALIQSGIVEIIEFDTGLAEGPGRTWVESLKVVEPMLQEAGVQITHLSPETYKPI